jgi:predicted transcriptional regulator
MVKIKDILEYSTFTQTDMKLISLLRHETTAKILTILTQNDSALHKDIAHSVGISSQALTWQMNQLKKTGLINAEKADINIKYSVNDANAIKVITNLTNTLKIN